MAKWREYLKLESTPLTSVYLKSGAIIVCPACNKGTVRLKKDVIRLEIIDSSMFEVIDYYRDQYEDYQPGDCLKCLACKKSFSTIFRMTDKVGFFG